MKIPNGKRIHIILPGRITADLGRVAQRKYEDRSTLIRRYIEQGLQREKEGPR